MLRITENLVGDISSSIVLDLNFVRRLLYFYKKRDMQTLDSVSGVTMRVCKHGKNSLLLNRKLFHFCFACFKGCFKGFGKTAISEQLGSVKEDD